MTPYDCPDVCPWGRTLVAVALAGCVGSIDRGLPAMRGSEGASGGGTGDQADVPYRAPSGCDPSVGPGHVVLRRLGQQEYNNTVRDLLGDSGRPADEFYPDTSLLTVDSPLFQQLQGAAERLASKHAAALMTCKPGSVADEIPCARTILKPFARRAWRRPVTDEEMAELTTAPGGPLQVAKASGDTFAKGVELAVQSILLSPNFLYHAEAPPAARTSGAPYALDGYALASRLSYFLWSSMPDDQLFAVAESGALLAPWVLAEQAGRMLADATKGGVLGERLAGGWLIGRQVDMAVPDLMKFPRYDVSLRDSAKMESSRFVNTFIEKNLDLRGLLDADFALINQRLAEHYGITGIAGNQFRRVPLAGNLQRGGILTQAGFLIATSKPTEPILPRRGVWIFQSLLCGQLGPPPPNANAEQATLEAMLGTNPTRRQASEARQAIPACGVCHKILDPLGLGLENYDAIGAWRTQAGGKPIYTHGEWNGGSFTGPRQMFSILKQDERLPACLSKVFLTQALGATTGGPDQCVLDDLAKSATETGFRARDLISAIVESQAFRFQSE